MAPPYRKAWFPIKQELFIKYLYIFKLFDDLKFNDPPYIPVLFINNELLIKIFWQSLKTIGES